MAGAAQLGNAQQNPQVDELGLREYNASCAGCHDASGKGDGAYAQFHKLRIPDLTLLTSRNNGAFPFERVREIIDGTQVVILHGTPGMPVWGDNYRLKAADACRPALCDSAEFVRARILALTEHIHKLNPR
jgi:mono/diheme cytochrome c family protein